METFHSTIYYSKYFIELNIDESTQYVALGTHKRHPIPRPFGQAMECLMSTSTEIDSVIKGFYCMCKLIHQCVWDICHRLWTDKPAYLLPFSLYHWIHCCVISDSDHVQLKVHIAVRYSISVSYQIQRYYSITIHPINFNNFICALLWWGTILRIVPHHNDAQMMLLNILITHIF